MSFALAQGPHAGTARIVTQQFRAAPEVQAKPAPELADLVPLRRVGLIQMCAVDDDVRTMMGLGHVSFSVACDVILSEAIPQLTESAESVTFRLDGRETAGACITYRGTDFLFADHDDPLVATDFVVFRSASEDASALWPDVVSTGAVSGHDRQP